MNRLLLFFCLVIAVGCDQNSSSDIFFGGKILKPTDSQVLLYGDESLIDSIQIQPNGTFLKQLDSLSGGLYNFIHKPEFQYILLEKGDSLLVRINTIDFDESLVFSGRGAAKNNFLIDVFLQVEKDYESIYKQYQKTPNLFKNHIDSLVAIQMLKYEKLVQKNDISSMSKSVLKASVLYNYYTKMEQYSYFQKSQPNSNHPHKMDELFYDYRNQLNLNDDELSAFRPYLRYLIARIDNEIRSQLPDNATPLLVHKNRLQFVKTEIKSSPIKSKLARYIAYDFMLDNVNIAESDSFLSLFHSMSIDDKIKTEILNLTSNINALQPGKPLPDLTLIDTQGNLINIGDLDNQRPSVFFFWSYDQNSHQLSMFSRIRRLSKRHPNVSFVGININGKRDSWNQVLEVTPKFRENVYHFQASNFEDLSKKMVLTNLNKIVYTDANHNILNGFSDIVSAQKELK